MRVGLSLGILVPSLTVPKAVIMNEHLVEALRRLRRTSNNTSVDRRLVTNVLLQFLNTPRGDAKRFEMLTLLSSILQWTDDEREKAGLQRSGSPAAKSSMLSPTSKIKALELEKTDETEVGDHTSQLGWGRTLYILLSPLVFLSPVGRVPSDRSGGGRISQIQHIPTCNSDTISQQPSIALQYRLSENDCRRNAKAGLLRSFNEFAESSYKPITTAAYSTNR